MPDRRLLVIGGSGELGRQLVLAADRWDVHATYLTRLPEVSEGTWHRLDISDAGAVHNLVRRLRPNAIIHTAVGAHNPADLQAIIVDGGKHVAEAAAQVGARCIVLSTDLVFDGTQGGYTEEDPPNPIMPYGQAKAEMERTLLVMEADLAIVRTSLIITLEPMGKHVDWIVNALRRGEPRDLFTDELRCPIWNDELAAALLELATIDYQGLIHIAGPEVTHRYALGMKLANYYGLDTSLITPALSANSGLNRPLDCTLNCDLAYRLLKTAIHGVSARFGT